MTRPSDDRPRPRVPEFLRWLFGHMLVGVVVGWSALAAILVFDVGRLRTLMADSPDRGVALTLLAFFFAITFGSVAMGFAVMSQPRDRIGDGD